MSIGHFWTQYSVHGLRCAPAGRLMPSVPQASPDAPRRGSSACSRPACRCAAVRRRRCCASVLLTTALRPPQMLAPCLHMLPKASAGGLKDQETRYRQRCEHNHAHRSLPALASTRCLAHHRSGPYLQRQAAQDLPDAREDRQLRAAVRTALRACRSRFHV